MKTPSFIIDVSNNDVSLRAAALASLELTCNLILVGEQKWIRTHLSSLAHDAERIRIVDAPDPLPNTIRPEKALKEFPKNAILVGMQLLRDTEASAFITIGRAAIAIAAAAQILQRLPGVRRNALAAIYPTLQFRRKSEEDAPFALILDIGANVNPIALDYLNNAKMGAAYAKCISGNEHPTVALLSNASGPVGLPSVARKADLLLQKAKNTSFKYLGLIRADRLMLGEADVILTDGYTGDIVIRTLEGLASSGEAMLKSAHKRFRWRMGVSMLGKGLSQLRELGNWENYGGAPLLGYEKTVMFTQANSTERAIHGVIRLATKLHKENLISSLQNAII